MRSPKTWLTACASYVCTNLSYVCAENLFVGVLPVEPYTCVSLIATGGPRISASPVEYSGLQVVVRDPDFESGMTRVESLHALFDNKVCALAPTYKGRFMANNEPGVHIVDGNGHVVYSTNYTYTSIRV